MQIAYILLGQPRLEGIVLLPEAVDVLCGDAYGFLVDFPQSVHLLLILPAGTSNLLRTATNEVDIVLPYGTSIFVMTDIRQHEFKGITDSLSSLSRLIGVEIVSSAHIVDVECP